VIYNREGDRHSVFADGRKIHTVEGEHLDIREVRLSSQGQHVVAVTRNFDDQSAVYLDEACF
jgi:hypothetical protein